MRSEEVAYLTASELNHLYRERVISPVEVVGCYLDRIARLDGMLHSYTTLNAETALKDAEESRLRILKGCPKSDMDGIPVALKDAIDTAGLRTTANSRVYADRIPEKDAHIVRLLKESGAVILGKNSMEEFSFSSLALDGPFPAARNPWNISCTPGGSCSGSAASVAAGLCAGAIGCDTGGSIRLPAAYCNIVGMKPGAGLVSKSGVFPLAETLDFIGPMTRTVEDAAMLLQVIAGYDPNDPASVQSAVPDYRAGLNQRLNQLRIGVPLELLENRLAIHPAVMQGLYDSIEVFKSLEICVEPMDFGEIALDVPEIWRRIVVSEAYASYKPLIQGEHDKLSDGFLELALPGAQVSAADYIDAMHMRRQVFELIQDQLARYDCLLLPAASTPALPFEQTDQLPIWRKATLMRRLFNLSGHPAIAVPSGFTEEGMPVSIQLAGRMSGEAALLAAAHQYEIASGWTKHHPKI